ncbi:MAG: KH domain-containing protein, partial [Candidatus Cloacimonetes bacterium]|nr:KH domain-containing protein [Candidatus Cloacimonadota bacterium]
KEQNLKRDEFEYKVTDKGSNGFFNLFGGKPTVIDFFIGSKDNGIKDFLAEVLKMMNIHYSSIDVKQDRKNYLVNIVKAREKGFLIGKEGRLLDSIQHIVNRMLINRGEEITDVVLDADGYRQKHEHTLKRRISSAVEKARLNGRSITLEKMHAEDRKIVHRIVEREDNLKTQTIGKGDRKKVIISPVSSGSNSQQKNRARKPRRRPNERSPRRPENRNASDE